MLETERLILRPLTPADAEALIALDADEEVTRYVDTPSGVDREGCWAAIEKATGVFLGWIELTPAGWLGYRLNRAAWGKGYAAEGSRALIARAFTESGLLRVMATTMAVNGRSRAVMRKSGLRYRLTFWGDWPEYVDGAEFGDVEYELLRSEWGDTPQLGDS